MHMAAFSLLHSESWIKNSNVPTDILSFFPVCYEVLKQHLTANIYTCLPLKFEGFFIAFNKRNEISACLAVFIFYSDTKKKNVKHFLWDQGSIHIKKYAI